MTRTHGNSIALISVGRPITMSPPMGLLCLSSALEQAGYETDILDFQIYPDKEKELRQGISDGRYLWVGFTALTPSVPQIKKHISAIRGLDPSVPIILGGIHGSSVPELSLKEFDLDAVCIGDGEESVVTFSEKVASGKRDYWTIPKIAALDEEGAYRFDEKLAKAHPPQAPGRPNWEKINLHDYQKCPMQYIRRRPMVAPIITSRGCPNRCSFCAVHIFSGSRICRRDPVTVVDEIEYLVKERGVQEIQLFDDNFNFSLDYAKTVLREWASRDLGIVWKAPYGLWVHNWDDEWFSLLKQTGCYQVGFGLETGSAEVLKRVNKRIKLDEVASAVRQYKKHGISTFGFFVFGMPGETEQTIEDTIRFACNLELDHIHAGILTPYPGSPIFNDALSRGMKFLDWEHYHHYHRTEAFNFCEVPKPKLEWATKRFFLRFYSRPSRALNMVNEIRHSGLKSFINIAVRVMLK